MGGLEGSPELLAHSAGRDGGPRADPALEGTANRLSSHHGCSSDIHAMRALRSEQRGSAEG